MKTDVTSSADVKAMVDRTRDVLGKLDILVNNAGMAAPPGMPFMNNTEEDWDRAFAVNTKSVFLTCKAVAPYFIERKAGRIINIASIAGRSARPPCRPTAWPSRASSRSRAWWPRSWRPIASP